MPPLCKAQVIQLPALLEASFSTMGFPCNPFRIGANKVEHGAFTKKKNQMPIEDDGALVKGAAPWHGMCELVLPAKQHGFFWSQ